jgi:hypothetical protein
VLHDDPRLTAQCVQSFGQRGEAIGSVLNLERLDCDIRLGLEYGNSTSGIGNINTYSEHKESSYDITTAAEPPLPIADSICSLTRATVSGALPAQIERRTMEGWLTDFQTSA